MREQGNFHKRDINSFIDILKKKQKVKRVQGNMDEISLTYLTLKALIMNL